MVGAVFSSLEDGESPKGLTPGSQLSERNWVRPADTEDVFLSHVTEGQ